MKPSRQRPLRANYGIDAPNVILNLFGSGLACLVLSHLYPPLGWLVQPAISLLLTGAVWLYGSKWGKLHIRDRMLRRMDWCGGETVLDVGCGHGLLLIGAAKRLPHGIACGVDIWSQKDLSGNRAEATFLNSDWEGVSERVKVIEADARRLPFDGETFDAILSLNVIHNIPLVSERERALLEMARVLKPGGKIVLTDFRNTAEYARLLRDKGKLDVCREIIYWLILPIFTVVAVKTTDV